MFCYCCCDGSQKAKLTGSIEPVESPVSQNLSRDAVCSPADDMRNLENNINRESDANKESNANRRSLSSTSSQDIAPDEAPAGRPHVRRKSYIPGDYETKVALDKYTKQDEQLATVDGEQGDSAET